MKSFVATSSAYFTGSQKGRISVIDKEGNRVSFLGSGAGNLPKQITLVDFSGDQRVLRVKNIRANYRNASGGSIHGTWVQPDGTIVHIVDDGMTTTMDYAPHSSPTLNSPITFSDPSNFKITFAAGYEGDPDAGTYSAKVSPDANKISWYAPNGTYTGDWIKQSSKTILGQIFGGAGTGAPKGNNAASTGMSIGAKIAIGVGIAAVLGTISYFVFRPKHA